MKIGVLALQGAFIEHKYMIERAGGEGVIVKKADQLAELDGLIIPGGESTTIGKLMRTYGFVDVIRQFVEEGKPVFGTCAGMIVLAKQITGQADAHLQLMDIRVSRNAFGRQRESFETKLAVKGIADDVNAVFIRAPLIDEVGAGVDVLATHNGQIVAAREGTMLAASFHPELTNDIRFHAYFLQMVRDAKSEGDALC